jgi:hypothetical protein
MKITEVPCKCECGWAGTVWDCEPDIDGDGSLGCPVCERVVDTRIEGDMAQFNLTITLEYDLVSASHKLQLVEEVRKWIAEDWQPLGGAFAHDGDFYQTMVREKPKEPPKYNPNLQYNKE